MTNNELIIEAEKEIKKIVARRLTCFDEQTQRQIVQTALLIFWKRNKNDGIIKRYLKTIVLEACRNSGLFKFRVSKIVTETEDGIKVEEIFQARTKKQQAQDNAEKLNLDDCHDIAAPVNNARIRLFDHIAKNASRMMKEVIARIVDGEDEDEVAESYGLKWSQIVYRLNKEAGNDTNADEQGQFSFGF